MNNKLFTVIAAMFLTLVSLRAFAQHPDVGATAFPFLSMDYDARSVAMGGASVAMPDDAFGVLSNPAAPGFGGRLRIMAGYRQVMMDVWGGPLGISFPALSGVCAVNFVALSTGEFDIFDENGDRTGLRASSSYTAAGVNYARVVYDNLSLGGTVKAIYHYIGAGNESYGADGYAVDAGVQYRLNGGRLVYGLVLRNFGFVRSGYLGSFNEYPMPCGVETGISYVPRHIPNLRAALDVNKVRGDYLNFEPAFEYALLSGALFLRGGYTFSYMDFEKALGVFKGERDETYQKSSANTLSLGLGVLAVTDNTDIRLDAAVQFYSGVSEPALVLSVSAAF